MGCQPQKKTEVIAIDVQPRRDSKVQISDMNRRNSSAIKVKTKNIVLEKKQKVTDQYKILTKLGAGAFGSVYKVLDNSSKMIRAMKIIKRENLKYQDDDQLFLKEIEILKNIDHPNIIKIYEYYMDSQQFYVITEYISGGELYDSISQWTDFNEPKAAYIMQQILSAIFYLHSLNIVHRDIKPENIMIETKKSGQEENKFSIKLIDFGTCNYLEPDNFLSLKVGTPYYIAPEVINKHYNHKCDVWSAGVTLFILLSGFPPFYGKTATKIFEAIKKEKLSFEFKEFKQVSEEAKDLISCMLEKNSNKRISAEKALNHKWFKMNNEEEKLDKGVLNNVLKNIKAFNAKEKLQQTAIAYIVHLLQDSKEIDELKKIFLKIDNNGDGRLTYDELRKGFEEVFGENITDIEFNKIVEDIDQDDDGYIGYEEFLRVALDQKIILTKENLRIAFEHFDANKDGKLSMEEVKNIMGTEGTAEILEIFKSVDSDSDGDISYEEFCILMQKLVRNMNERPGTLNEHFNLTAAKIKLSKKNLEAISHNE